MPKDILKKPSRDKQIIGLQWADYKYNALMYIVSWMRFYL